MSHSLPKGLQRAVNRINDGVLEKRCPGCGGWFPRGTGHFHAKGGLQGDGTRKLHSLCKTCQNDLMRPYLRERRQRLREPGWRALAECLGQPTNGS